MFELIIIPAGTAVMMLQIIRKDQKVKSRQVQSKTQSKKVNIKSALKTN